jgi:hypothetical protein
MRTCAFLTMDDLADFVTDDKLAEAPLAEMGWAVEHVPWRRPEEGEDSLFFFGGELSHAVLKSPKEEDFRVQEEHGGLIQPVQPPAPLAELGHRIVESLPIPPLYARVDLARLDSGQYALMELELIEPSLYFRTDPKSPRRFARAFDEWMMPTRSRSSC